MICGHKKNSNNDNQCPKCNGFYEEGERSVFPSRGKEVFFFFVILVLIFQKWSTESEPFSIGMSLYV